jgi:hypothetical protein
MRKKSPRKKEEYLMAVEHNFARGDILRRVLERTGIASKQPLNLRRGGLDQTQGAELLRKLRGYSQNAALLSSKLDDLIELRERQDEPPRIQSWRPIKRYREHKALEEWVKARPPSAGITQEQVEKEYPENLAEKRAFRKGTAIGAGVGAVGGGTAGFLSGKGLPHPLRHVRTAWAGVAGAGVGAVAGRVIGGLPYSTKRIKEHTEALQSLHKSMKGAGTVSPKSLRSTVPKVVFIQNNDDTNFLTVDAVVGLSSWPQKILPGTGIVLRPPNGTIYAKANAAPVNAWIVAG